MRYFMKGWGVKFILSFVFMLGLVMPVFSEGTGEDTSLVGFWHFDEGEGEVAKDSSGRGNEGKIFNVAWVKEGKRGSALKFDIYNVTDDYVNCGNDKSLDITDAITLEAWIKPTHEIHADQAIISKEWAVPYSLICAGGGAVYLLMRFSDDSEVRLDTGQCVKLGEWNHVVGTYDGEYRKIYVNGELKAGPERIGKTIANISHHQVFIGCISPGSNPFDGAIDEVKIYNRALTEEEIIASYKSAGEGSGKSDMKETVGQPPPAKATSQQGASQGTSSNISTGDRQKGLVAVIGDNGELRQVNVDGKVCAEDVGLSIMNYGGRLFGKQGNSAHTKAMKRTDDSGESLVRGRITSTEPKYEGRDILTDVKSFLYEERIAVKPDQIKIEYEVTAGIAMEGVMLQFAGSARADTYVIHGNRFTRKGTISEITPHPSRVVEDTMFQWVEWIGWLIKDGKGIKIRPESGIWSVRLSEEGFIWSAPKHFFKAREKAEFSIAIEPLTTEEVDRLLAQRARPPVFDGKLAINSIAESSKEVGKSDKFELTLNISATYNDAFDPDEIDVEGYFTSPSGTTTNICGFLYQDYERDPSDTYHLTAMGSPCWKIRFAPIEVGRYRYYVTVKDKSGQVKSEERTFECVASRNRGFIRVSKKDPLYFEFDTGEFYYPIGHDVPCTGAPFWQITYDHYFTKMAEHGMNATRNWGPHIYRARVADMLSRMQRLGYQSLGDNWLIDEMIDSAEKNGIYTMFTILNHGYFIYKRHNTTVWYEQNPYETTKGGVCPEPKDFFIKKEARDLFKKELRYMIARWGYSPAIWMWEMWNENDGGWVMQDCGEENVFSWYKEIVPYLRSIDPWKHLISTSFCQTGDPIPKKIWDLPEMDVTQYHMYPHDTAPFPTVKGMLSTYGFFKMFNKPAVIGEFGIADINVPERFDFFGTNFHYGIWSSCMMPLSGVAMIYAGVEAIEQSELYFVYGPVVNFTKGEDRRGKGLRPATVTIDNPSLGVCGIQSEREAQFWVYSRDPRVAGALPKEGVSPFPLFKDVTVMLSGLSGGEYKVEFWDTWRGVITNTENLNMKEDGTMVIKIPDLNSDIAAKVKLVRAE